MFWLLLLLRVSLLFFTDFKTDQLQHDRVKEAYVSKGLSVFKILQKNHIQTGTLNLYLRAFKQEKSLEIWGKKVGEEAFVLLQTMFICRLSGGLGPKRREGDLQIPEGYYAIDGFNPNSHFYLSLHVNYPNPSDQVLGYQPKLGGLIFLHGDCVTIGCLPLTNDKIKELYIYCVEARNSGQLSIPITIFPTRLSDTAFHNLTQQYAGDSDKLNV